MILIEPDSCVPRAALPKRELARFLADACERIGIKGEVTVLLTTDERMRALNQTFRHKNKSTDVLSFPPAEVIVAGQPVVGGDLAISAQMALEQAASYGHTLMAEMKILMLHGLLHLAGMDHEQDQGSMRRRESRLRREYGLPAGLLQRTNAIAPEAGTQRTRSGAAPASPRVAKKARAGVPGKLTAQPKAGSQARAASKTAAKPAKKRYSKPAQTRQLERGEGATERPKLSERAEASAR